jgi:hypothetical protein
MSTNKLDNRSTILGFSLLWILVTMIGLVVGLAMMFAGVGAAINNVTPMVFGGMFGGVLGLVCGFAQWLVLRRQLENVTTWIVATFLGWAIFWSLNMAGLFGEGNGVAGKVLEGLDHGALFGLLLGIFQWLVIRNKLQNAGWWVLVNLGGWSLGAAIGDGVKAALKIEAPLEIVLGLLVATILAAFSMAWLIRNYSQQLAMHN